MIEGVRPPRAPPSVGGDGPHPDGLPFTSSALKAFATKLKASEGNPCAYITRRRLITSLRNGSIQRGPPQFTAPAVLAYPALLGELRVTKRVDSALAHPREPVAPTRRAFVLKRQAATRHFWAILSLGRSGSFKIPAPSRSDACFRTSARVSSGITCSKYINRSNGSAGPRSAVLHFYNWRRSGRSFHHTRQLILSQLHLTGPRRVASRSHAICRHRQARTVAASMGRILVAPNCRRASVGLPRLRQPAKLPSRSADTTERPPGGGGTGESNGIDAGQALHGAARSRRRRR
jgi:hypothetical protein